MLDAGKPKRGAHLFYPGRITETAQRRLYAIAELNDLGSGHLLAEKDMEIRGVGNLLGPEQHGQIAAVSIEVYTEMLAEEIAKLKGEKIAEEKTYTSIDINLDARLSPSYIQEDDMRIEYYGRLSETQSLATVSRLAKELRERYGPIPQEVKSFIDLVKLRILATDKGVATIKEHMTDIQLSFDHENLDYDALGIKKLPFNIEPTRYPPGFSIKKTRTQARKLARVHHQSFVSLWLKRNVHPKTKNRNRRKITHRGVNHKVFIQLNIKPNVAQIKLEPS